MKLIPYSRQTIDKNDINEVVKTLKSDFLTQGPKINLLEKKFKKIVNSNYCTAVNSATSALHIACIALGLKKGDYLWTVPNSFVSSSNCGLLVGAKVDFVDIDPLTYNMCTKKLEQKFNNKIVTLVWKFEKFYPAEDYHQDYYEKNFIRYLMYKKGCKREETLKKIWN